MVLRLLHRDLPEVATKWLSRLDIDPSSRFGAFVLKKVIALHARNLSWAAARCLRIRLLPRSRESAC